MKLFTALCILGAVAAGLAMPQHGERPQFGDHPSHHFLPPRPRPPMNPGMPRPDHHHMDHPHMEHPHFGPELREFMGHVRDFVKLIPRREIREIVRAHMQDPELRATLKFVRTPEFHEIMHTMHETPEVQAIGQYFEQAAWPWLQDQIEEVAREMQVEGFGVAKRSTGGLNGLIDAVVAVLPKEQLRALFDEKMANSAVFRSVIEIVTSDELVSLIETAKQSPVVREQAQRLLANGIDLDKIMESKMALMGF